MKEINYMAEDCKKLQLPQGWRWLKIREKTRVGDVCCDARMPEAPIRVEYGGDQLTRYHHPVRRCMDGSTKPEFMTYEEKREWGFSFREIFPLPLNSED